MQNRFSRVLVTSKPKELGEDVLVVNVTERSIARGAVKVLLAHHNAEDAGRAKKETHAWKLMWILVLRQGQVSTKEEIADLFYSELEDGGPLDPFNRISNLMTHLHPQLHALGLEIVNMPGFGYYLKDCVAARAKMVAA